MGSPKIETLVASAGIVGAADQIMKGMEKDHEHMSAEARSHYVKAVIAGAIAVGAFEMLRRDEDLDSDDENDALGTKYAVCTCGESPHTKACAASAPGVLVVKETKGNKHHAKDKGHLPAMLTEVAGAYAMGRQLLGHREHRIIKLVAEGLGAAALAKDVNHHMVD